jgi:hypothetical protein
MIRLSSVFTIGTCALVAAAAYADDATHVSPSKWAPWIDGEWDPGTHRSIGLFEGFAPLMQDDKSLLFVNPRMRFDDQDSQEYNWGLGYRRMVDKDWIVGGYGYVDRNVLGSHSFNEVTLGLEAIGEELKFRINDYQPFGVRTYSGQDAQAIVTGGNLEIQSDTERSMQGDDIEAGYRVPMNQPSDPNQLWVYAGLYRFSAPEVRTIEGPRARFEYEIGDVTVADRNLRLRLSTELQHDDIRGTQWFAGIRIGIPLGDEGTTQYTSKLTPLERHMVDPVHRDVDIVTSKGNTKTEGAINTYNNETVSAVSTVNANSNVPSAVTSAGNNSVVVMDGSHGTINIPDNTSIMMNNGQTLLGGGSYLQLRGANSGAQTIFYAPGSMPTVTGTGTGVHGLISLADNGVVRGLRASTGGLNVINSMGVMNFSISNNALSYNDVGGSRSVILVNGGSGLIENNTVTTGVTFFGSDIVIANVAQVAIRNNNLTVSDRVASFSFFYAGAIVASAAQNTTITGNAITTNSYGVHADATNAAMEISHNTINLAPDSGAGGIVVYANGSGINSNVINAGSSHALQSSALAVGGDGIALNNNRITGVDVRAISLDNATNTSGRGNVYSGATLCSTNGSNTGSVGFVDGRHCP